MTGASRSRPRIRRLPPHVANQIAAGEVVERPASVVKELVENSLDAGARHVEVEVEQGGLRRIRVRDDGCGIPPEDLPLAVAPHATSKLSDAGDLAAVATLGFRGEALASIGAVARLVITTRTEGDDSGWRLECAASRAGRPQPAAHPAGTTVEVTELFHELPARRRFLRSARTEFLHLDQALRALALARFDVGFGLRHNGRTVFQVAAAADSHAHRRRLERLCGRRFADHAREVEAAASGMRLHGWVADAGYARSQSDQQYFFVNGRAVRDRLVSHAVRLALEEGLPPGRYPAYVLHLELDPAEVDVNVHPTKHEVRFRQGRQVHDFLEQALVRHAGEPVVLPAPAYPSAAPAAPPRVKEPAADRPAGLRVLGQARGYYLIVDTPEGLACVHLPRALAALAAARLERELAAGQVAARPLLMPVRVPGAAAVLSAHAAALEALGLEWRAAGEDAELRALPVALGEVEPASLVEALSALSGPAAPASLSAAWLAALAGGCRFPAAELSRAEQEALLAALDRHGLAGPANPGWHLWPWPGT